MGNASLKVEIQKPIKTRGLIHFPSFISMYERKIPISKTWSELEISPECDIHLDGKDFPNDISFHLFNYLNLPKKRQPQGFTRYITRDFPSNVKSMHRSTESLDSFFRQWDRIRIKTKTGYQEFIYFGRKDNIDLLLFKWEKRGLFVTSPKYAWDKFGS